MNKSKIGTIKSWQSLAISEQL